MTISKKPSNPGLSDPVLARQTEADLAKASLIAKGKPTVTSAGELILPSTTVSTTSNSFTTTTSANNQPADVVTVTRTSGAVYVSSIDQTIQQTVINNPIAGVSSIIAGDKITITSTGTSGTGDVTITSITSNIFSSITMTNTPSGAANTIQYGLGNLAVWLDTGWTIGEYNANTDVWGGEGIRINPSIEGDADINLPADTSNNPVSISNYGGNVVVNTGNSNQWKFDGSGNLTLPGNTFAVKYANGTQAVLGSNTGQWAFNTDTAYNSSNNGLYISPSEGIDDGGAYFPYANESTTTRLYNNSGAGIELSAGANTWQLLIDGSVQFPTITTNLHNGGNQSAQTLKFGDPDQQVIITGPTPDANTNAQRIIIQGQAGNGTGEGGDVYLWGGDADTNGGDIKIYAGDADNVSTGSGGYVNIEGGSGFDFGGYASIQGGQSSNGQGAYAQLVGGYGLSGGFANIVGGQGYAGPGGAVNITGGSSGNGVAEYGNVNLGAGASIWTFDNTGNLVLPNNTFAVNYANGTQVPLGGGGNTGNVTFDDITIQGVNQLNLSYDPLATANLAYLQVRGGDVASHIHLDTGNNAAYDLIVGNDDKFVQVSSTGNIIMSSYDGNTTYVMTLDNTGDLILAGGSSIIRSVANSSLDPINPNVSTMTFIPDAGYISQSLVLDPTAPGHIHLRALSANIDEPLANIFLGGEDSSFEVGYYNGSAPNVFIHSGGNTWEFLNNGNLVFPRDAAGNTDPFLRITGGASPRILSEDISLAGPANLEITALNTIFTGSSGSAIKIYADDGEIGSTGNLQLWTNSGGNTEYSWTFGNDGNLTTSSNLVISPSGIGTGTAIAQTDAPLQIASTDANGSASIGWYGNPTGPGNVVQVALNQTGGSMTVVTGDYSDTTYVWDFDNTGNLTLPTDGELHATGKIGYTSGGTATQTGIGQGVTLNQLTGQITLAKSSWSAGDTEVFNISCNKVANADYVMAQVINGSEASYFNTVAYPFTAIANSIRVQVTAVVASTSTPVVQFLIMKAATS